MVHRSKIYMVNIDSDPKEIINQVIESPFTRVPVWKDHNENIIGLLHAKNLLKLLKNNSINEISKEMINQSLIKTWFVPETTTLKDQLQMHLSRKIKLAMVVDEYGVLNGMISLEDIIEEIVGDINDEFDDDGIQFSKLDSSNYIFEGKTSLNNVLKTVDGKIDFFDPIKGESDTLAGLILEMKGNIPENGETLYLSLIHI